MLTTVYEQHRGVELIREQNKMPSSLAELLAQLDREDVRDHRRYQTVRRYLDFRARETGTPISGIFELTPLCNLDCKMCYVHLNKAQLGQAKLLTEKQWESLIEQAIDAGMLYAKLTGGECLSYPEFKQVYLFLREKGIETGLLTNGVLLDQEMAVFLRENPPASIRITLYGASEEAYERVTGRRVFSVVMENIRRLQAYSLPVTIAVTPNAFMTDGEEILRLAHGMGLTAKVNAGLMAPRQETGRTKADADLDTYVDLFKLNHTLNGGEFPAPCEEADLPQPGGKTDPTPRGVPCGAGRSGFSIGWDGTMRPCNTFPNIAENAVELGFAEAWKRIHAQAEQFLRPVECEGCAYKERCGCCLAEHAADAPVGHASPMVCARTRRLAAEGLIR